MRADGPGRTLLQRLVNLGIPCTYVLLHALPYIMKEVGQRTVACTVRVQRLRRAGVRSVAAQVTLALLGAHALFSNGTVMARVGTAAVAMAASTNNVPVLVCCETYKFTDRVQLDSIVYNELGAVG
jgi:translation initiation factor eIF-2B subunit delta